MRDSIHNTHRSASRVALVTGIIVLVSALLAVGYALAGPNPTEPAIECEWKEDTQWVFIEDFEPAIWKNSDVWPYRDQFAWFGCIDPGQRGPDPWDAMPYLIWSP